MKNLRLRFVLGLMAAVGLSLAAFQCGHRDPLSPETQGSIGTDGVLKIDMRLSKSVALTIDSVTVVARRAQGEPVRARLEIRGNQATGSLKVSPGAGWAITAEVYIQGMVYYRGQSGPQVIAAGQTVPVNILLQGAIADLKVGRVYISERDNPGKELTDVKAGDEVDLRLEYENTGPADATGWRAEVYIDGVLQGALSDASVAARESKVIRYQWTALSGTHTVEFKLDTGDAVKESNEANNTARLTFTVSVPVDLVAEEVFLTLPDATEPIDPKSLKVGDKVDLNVRVRNTGSVAITGWRSETYIDGTRYSSGENHSVDANTTTIVYVGWTVVSGTHTVEFRVDTGDVVRESNEANNTARLTFTVPPEGGIIAGRSIDGVELGFTKAQVIGKLGEPSEITDNGNFSYDSGVTVMFDERGGVNMIMVMSPYSNTTEEGIGIGATANDITGHYGTDYLEITVAGFPAYWYANLGIAFVLDESNICFAIVIFSPSTAKAALGYTDTMDRLQRFVSYVAPEIKPIHVDLTEQIHKVIGSYTPKPLSNLEKNSLIR